MGLGSDGGTAAAPDVQARIATALRELTGDDLLAHGSVMAGASVLAGGLNYAYQVYVGRVLGPEQYAVFGALFALFYLLNVLGRGIELAAAHHVAAADEPGRAAARQRGLLVRALAVSTATGLALALASPLVADFLGVGSPWPVVVVAAILPAGLALTANLGALQGLQRFPALGGAKVALAAVKLALGVALVAGGYGVAGAFGAMVGSSLCLLVGTTYYLRRRLATPTAGDRREADRALGGAYRYAVPSVLVGFCLTVPTTVDVVLVTHAFADAVAGRYVAASVFGKALIFLPLGVVTALFPKAAAAGEATLVDDIGDSLFARGLAYVGALCGAGAAALWIAPDLWLELFYGEAYVAAAPLVRWYGLAILAFALALVCLYYQLARGRKRFVYGFAGGIGLEIAAIWLVHPSPLAVVQLMLVAHLALLAYGLLAVVGGRS